MPRSTREWVGKTDDSKPPRSVYGRAFERAGGQCEACHVRIGPKRWHLDHRKRLKDGGENRETNLQVLCVPCHKEKTSGENRAQAKANRVKSLTLGIRKPKSGRGFRGWRKFDGSIVWKDDE